MRTYIILPLLALGATAATLYNFKSSSLLGSHPPLLRDSHNRRQLHNADFSSAGPPPKGPITNTDSSGSASSGSGSLNSRSPTIYDPILAARGPVEPLGRRVISVVGTSNPGVESVSVINGDPTVPAQAETGSAAAADIDVMNTRVPLTATSNGSATKAVLSRQVDDDASDPDLDDTPAADDPAEDSALDSTVPDADPDAEISGRDQPVARAIGLNGVLPLNQNLNPALCLALSPRGNHMLNADTPVDFPIPGTATAASGRGGKLFAKGLLGSLALANCDEQKGSLSLRKNNLDLPMALPVTPPVSLPVRRNIDSASPASEPQTWSLGDSKTKRQTLPALPVPVSLPQLPQLPRDALVNELVSFGSESGVLAASVPVIVRKEVRL